VLFCLRHFRANAELNKQTDSQLMFVHPAAALPLPEQDRF
jgi:hypothetical protein